MYDTKQKWFKEAKYGLFVHFGLYSILEGAYKRKVTNGLAEWIEHSFDIDPDEYAKLIESFDPYKLDIDDLVKRAKDWGMKYVVFTSKHHEGFALFDTKYDDFNIMNSPYHKDIIKEVSDACKKYGLYFGIYYSQAQDWHDKNGLWSGKETADFHEYYLRKCLPQIKELLTNYGKVDLLWLDTPISMSYEECSNLYKMIKDIQPDCIISGRIGHDLGDYMTTTDNYIPRLTFNGDFEVPCTLNDTWGYSKYDKTFKSADTILKLLLKINNRGGNYLLNIGPDHLGMIPNESIAILDEVADYVNANEEAIFKTFGLPYYPYDIEWGEMTANKGHLYLHILRPKRSLDIQNIANKIKRAYIVDSKQELPFLQTMSCEGYGEIAIDIPKEYHDKKFCIALEYNEDLPIFEAIRDK